jgi:hypothetical protein
MGCRSSCLGFVIGHPEHGIGLLVVTFEPLQNGLWSVRRNHNFEPSLGDPSSRKWAEKIRFTAAVRAGPVSDRQRLRGSAPDREHKPAQDATRLVCVEVGAVESRHEADHLLGREPLAGHDCEMIFERFGHHIPESALDLRGIELELLLRYPRRYPNHTYLSRAYRSIHNHGPASGPRDIRIGER